MGYHLGFDWSTSSIAPELHRSVVGVGGVWCRVSVGPQGNGICISTGEDTLGLTEAGGLVKSDRGDRHSNGGETDIS